MGSWTRAKRKAYHKAWLETQRLVGRPVEHDRPNCTVEAIKREVKARRPRRHGVIVTEQSPAEVMFTSLVLGWHGIVPGAETDAS